MRSLIFPSILKSRIETLQSINCAGESVFKVHPTYTVQKGVLSTHVGSFRQKLVLFFLLMRKLRAHQFIIIENRAKMRKIGLKTPMSLLFSKDVSFPNAVFSGPFRLELWYSNSAFDLFSVFGPF